MTTVARHVLVTGRVQGVAFRWATRDRAVQLGLQGWVRNLADGRVEAHVEGDEATVTAMLDWFSKGPALARVDDLQARESEAQDRQGFEIRPTASL